MKEAKVFRKIHEKNKIVGLEMIDLGILAMCYLVLFLVSKNLILNIGLLISAYLILRFYKRGKPAHWSMSVLRFLFVKKNFGLRKEREIVHD